MRAVYNWIGGVVGICFAIWSLRQALDQSSTFGPLSYESFTLGPWTHDQLGMFLIGFWAVVPPLFFWLDWVLFCSRLAPSDPAREVAKHTHDLSRNIWLALVGVLAVLF